MRQGEIYIKHFGPIDKGYEGYMPIYPITMFCGNQGSGKSTVAKLISTFNWLEKALVRGDESINKRTNTAKFLKHHCTFHRIHNYFKEDTELHYRGIKYDFHYKNETFSVEEKNEDVEYLMPKIIYVPAERNFLTCIEHPEILREIPDSLYSMFVEYDKARKELNRDFVLPIDNLVFQYDKLKDISWLKNDKFKVKVSEAASGFQSMIPMLLVTKYMLYIIDNRQSAITNAKQSQMIEKRINQILADDTISEETRKILLSKQSSLLKYSRLINIVEEPEQNLYPLAQREVLYKLFEARNFANDNLLVITTHSPYLIDYTTLAIKAYNTQNNKEDVQKIVPEKSQINGEDVCIYQIENGRIERLKTFEGMPSDSNLLNQELCATNESFAQLLEFED
ncbi:MAG: ATP-binding protein [Bacteroidales bacterium]|nr:ATP-binding protein [Bacteroidales bacterium]